MRGRIGWEWSEDREVRHFTDVNCFLGLFHSEYWKDVCLITVSPVPDIM